MVSRNVPKRVGLKYKLPTLLKVCQKMVKYIVLFMIMAHGVKNFKKTHK